MKRGGMHNLQVSCIFAGSILIHTFPNLELLSLRRVFAFPNASRMGLVFRTLCSSCPMDLCASLVEQWSMVVIRAKYAIITLVDSVLPEPLSPLIIID